MRDILSFSGDSWTVRVSRKVYPEAVFFEVLKKWKDEINPELDTEGDEIIVKGKGREKVFLFLQDLFASMMGK